jgi:hypothetical protein
VAGNNNCSSNDNVTLRAEFSKSIYIGTIMWFILGIVGLVLYFIEPNDEAKWLGIILTAISVISFLFKFIRTKRTKVECTDAGFIGKYKRTVVDIPFDKLHEIKKIQTLFGKIVRCGTLVVVADYEKYKYVGIKNIDKLIADIKNLRDLYVRNNSNEVSES